MRSPHPLLPGLRTGLRPPSTGTPGTGGKGRLQPSRGTGSDKPLPGHSGSHCPPVTFLDPQVTPDCHIPMVGGLAQSPGKPAHRAGLQQARRATPSQRCHPGASPGAQGSTPAGATASAHPPFHPLRNAPSMPRASGHTHTQEGSPAPTQGLHPRRPQPDHHETPRPPPAWPSPSPRGNFSAATRLPHHLWCPHYRGAHRLSRRDLRELALSRRPPAVPTQVCFRSPPCEPPSPDHRLPRSVAP